MYQASIPNLSILKAGEIMTVKGSRDFTASLLKRFPRLVAVRFQAGRKPQVLKQRIDEMRRLHVAVLLHFERSGTFYSYWTNRAALALETKSETCAEVIRLNHSNAWGQQLQIVGDGVRLQETCA